MSHIKKMYGVLTSCLILGGALGCGNGGAPAPDQPRPTLGTTNEPTSEILSSLANPKRVVILGASVSKGSLAPSPGQLLALELGASPGAIQIRAHDGEKSTIHRDFIENQLASIKPELLVGVDLFFHDYKSKSNFSSTDGAYVDSLVSDLSKSSGIVVLATIPSQLAPGPAVETFNEFLMDLKSTYKNLVVLDFGKLIQKVTAEKVVVQFENDKLPISLEELFVDPRHPNFFGSLLIADELLKALVDHFGGESDTEGSLLFRRISVR